MPTQHNQENIHWLPDHFSLERVESVQENNMGITCNVVVKTNYTGAVHKNTWRMQFYASVKSTHALVHYTEREIYRQTK